jgi:hypothetical protein
MTPTTGLSSRPCGAFSHDHVGEGDVSAGGTPGNIVVFKRRRSMMPDQCHPHVPVGDDYFCRFDQAIS